MRTLKNNHKIISILLFGIFLISIIILPNSNIVAENTVYDNTSILTSEEPNHTFDNIVDNAPPQLSGSDLIYNQTFSINQSEDDAYGHTFAFLPPFTFYDGINISMGFFDKDDPIYPTLSHGIALRWDITVPKYAHITKAYINLTVANLTSGGMPWTGFNTSISAFNEPSTNDFSNPSEFLRNRPRRGDLLWELDGTELVNQTLQTVDISELLQQIIVLDGWDGIFGAFILPGVGTDNDLGLYLFEIIQFWAYGSVNPEYYPKLFVEWEILPYFINIPEDKYLFEETPGYTLKWQVGDDNPETFKLTCNVSIPGIPHYNDTWTSGWVTYDLPALESGFYNFTAYFNDTDGHLIWDSVIIEVEPPKPIISSGTYKIDRPEDDAWYKPKAGSAFAEYDNTLQLGGSWYENDENQRIICLRFNTTVPKHVRIKNVYVNLTVISNSSNYNGFTSKIYLFYPPVADFTDDYDRFTIYPEWNETRPSNRDLGWGRVAYPPIIPPLEWILPMSLGETIQTPNFTSQLQAIIDFPNYNGYIGLFIMPTGKDVSFEEKINTYSYDGGIADEKPQFTPTLFVEWEGSPHFVSTPANINAKNGIHGYHLDWIVADDNPTTFTITCNDTVSNIPPGSIIYSGVWQSGIEKAYNWIFDNEYINEVETITTKIRYDLPPLDIGVYNFTIRINDADLWYNLDSVIVNVTDLDLPVINIEFIQKGKKVDYFQCGNGPFTMRIYNSTPINPELWLTAYYPGYRQYIFSVSQRSGIPVFIYIREEKSPLSYGASCFIYNPVLGCYELTYNLIDEYIWYIYIMPQTAPSISLETILYKRVKDIEYNLLNRFEIRINGPGEYIYNQTIYGGRWARPIKEIWNKDLTPPIYSEPEFIEPDEPDKHYEVNIWAGSEAYGAKIDEVVLYYSVDDGPFEEIMMVLKDGKYSGEIPPQEEGATIDFYIKITDIAGNVIETDIYHEKAPTFEEPSIIIPVLGILLGILGALSIVVIYRHKRAAALKKVTSEKKIKKVKK